jgi:hypothetical protein
MGARKLWERYRLAALAERFGADALLPDVLEAISAACPCTRERHPEPRCRAYLPDLTEPRPPDLTVAAGTRLRVVSGGKVSSACGGVHGSRRQCQRQALDREARCGKWPNDLAKIYLVLYRSSLPPN